VACGLQDTVEHASSSSTVLSSIPLLPFPTVPQTYLLIAKEREALTDPNSAFRLSHVLPSALGEQTKHLANPTASRASYDCWRDCRRWSRVGNVKDIWRASESSNGRIGEVRRYGVYLCLCVG
jgi:hypothetical protein